MNFLNIVIQGYCNENNREYLVDYFISEFKKAEKDNFCSTDLFFGGCFKIIEEFNKNLKDQIHNQQRELNQYLKSVGANKDEKFVNHFNEQIEYEKLNGNTNFRLENGTMLRLTQKQITDIETAISFANSKLNSAQSKRAEPKQETLTFENHFDNISPIDIYNHFQAGLFEKKYLTEEELTIYLKAAFELQKPPKKLFKIKNMRTKQAIIKVFYQYFKLAAPSQGKQKQYAALLGDYFEGFRTENVSTNFSK
jgi:hypothetical protein